MTAKLHETRQKIIDYLKEKELATVDELAEVVHLTPMAVRYHLNVLQSENLIHTADIRHPSTGRGRPQQIYQLSEAADALFPVDYYSLTGYLLDEMNIKLGEKGVYEVFCRIADRLAQDAPPPTSRQSIEDRLEQIVAFLSDKGFVIDWENNEGVYFLHTYSCPYRQLAKTHKNVCMLDQRIITSMLSTPPVRVACLSAGDNHCTYRIPDSLIGSTSLMSHD